MHFGGAMFFTDYSMSAMELARALEERGFESVWAPEHSHIPLSRKTPFPGGGDLPKAYYDAMDPFVVLAAASQVTKTIKLGTGVLLVQQRDAIQTAKLVASIDQVSQGRFLFGVGGGWNQDKMENHGTVYASRFKRMRESIEAMKEIWTKPEAEYHGEFVHFDPMIARPKPVSKPHPPIHVGGVLKTTWKYGTGSRSAWRSIHSTLLGRRCNAAIGAISQLPETWLSAVVASFRPLAGGRSPHSHPSPLAASLAGSGAAAAGATPHRGASRHRHLLHQRTDQSVGSRDDGVDTCAVLRRRSIAWPLKALLIPLPYASGNSR